MTEEPVVADRREVTADEMAVAFSGPAPGANRFFVTIGQPGVRIAFVEQQPGTEVVHFRVAVTLHPLDAINLSKLLSDLLAGVEDQIAKFQTESVDG